MKEYKVIQFACGGFTWAKDGETIYKNNYTYIDPDYPRADPEIDYRKFYEYILNRYAKQGWNFKQFDRVYLILEREI